VPFYTISAGDKHAFPETMAIRNSLHQRWSARALFAALFFSSATFATSLQCKNLFIADPFSLLVKATHSRLKQDFRIKSAIDNRFLDLPSDREAYRKARFVVSRSPRQPIPEGTRWVGPLEFGYNLSETFRRLGPLNYILVSKDGKQVLEVAAGSHEALKEIKSHLLGRTLSSQELQRISEINRKLIDELRSHPEAQRRLKEFAAKRKWPAGLEDRAQLAYFSTEILNLREWSEKNNYTAEEMRDAGWILMKFDRSGRPYFDVNTDHSIKIPFFSDSTETSIPIWRTRNLAERTDGKKYIGWQIDRSIERNFTTPETLYKGWKLGEARGKTIVITEGEFKCLVAEDATGILTLGIPGITQFTSKMAEDIVRAAPEEVIVVLDRDPKGKGLMRVDEVTDSERAAYTIAKELENAGGKNVRVGILPDAFQGSKVGIDDLILARGTQPYTQVLKEAVSSSEYAQKISLDPNFVELHGHRQKMRKTIENYENSSFAGGPEVDSVVLAQAKKEINTIEAQYNRYLKAQFDGARTLNEPSARFSHLRRLREEPSTPLRLALENGKTYSTKSMSDEILMLDYMTSDLDVRTCKPKPCQSIPISSAQILKEVAAPHEQMAAEDRAQRLLADRLALDFPKDEYQIEFNANVNKQTIPLVIIKKSSDTVVAIARLQTGTSSRQLLTSFQRAREVLRPSRSPQSISKINEFVYLTQRSFYEKIISF